MKTDPTTEIQGAVEALQPMEPTATPRPNLPSLETSPVRWWGEDELPEMEDSDFEAIFEASRVVEGVRLYPFVEDSAGNRIWITDFQPGLVRGLG